MLRGTRALAGCVSLGLSLACTPQQAPTEDSTAVQTSTREPATPQIGAWVRVDGQRLLFAPDPDARLALESGPPYRIAEIVSLVNDRFVELRTLAVEPEALCATSSGTDLDFELHFFAEVSALQTVLVTPKVVELDDGTKLELAPGVPVDTSGGVPILDVGGGGRFAVPLDVGEIGWWYTPASQSAPPRPESGCSRSNSLYAMKGPKHAIPKMARGYDPDGPWVPCFGWHAEAGATLTWRESGTIAGTTRRDVRLPTVVPERDGKVCFTAADFGLCISTEQLTRTEMGVCLRDDVAAGD